jgi:ABC-type nitrate/sulfonate/bicarbonate transport system permease component
VSDVRDVVAQAAAHPTASKKLAVTLSPKLISPIVLLALWEMGVRFEWADPRLVAPPSLVMIELWHIAQSGELAAALAASLSRVVAGFVLAALVGIGLGCFMARVRTVEFIFDPVIELLRPVSPLALFPLFILWFGIGEASKVFIIAFACSFPIILNTYAGVRGIDATYFRAARSLGASAREIMQGIVLRGSLPHIFTGLRLAWGIALIVVVAAEMIGAVRGIGYMVLESQQTFRIPRLFASIAVIGLVGFLTDLGFRYVRRRMLPWYIETKE